MNSTKLVRVTFTFCILYSTFYISSCSIEKQISRSAQQVITDPSLKTAHVGISIYEPETGKRWYDHNGDKYFVPASNTKIPTCYAGMKYLGDSLIGLKWQNISDTAINIFATGDPSFLHSDFKTSPVLDFLKKNKKTIYLSAVWQDASLGSGWSWNDYNSYYMAERSPLPVYDNIINVKLNRYDYRLLENKRHSLYLQWSTIPSYFRKDINDLYILPLHIAVRREMTDSNAEKKALLNFSVEREMAGNKLSVVPDNSAFSAAEIPFYTNG